MNKREISLLIIIVLGALLLFSKSLVFDEVKNLEGFDLTFKEDISTAINQTYSNTIIKHRLIKITSEKKDGNTIYTGKVRKYFLGVIPFSDIKIIIEYDESGLKSES